MRNFTVLIVFVIFVVGLSGCAIRAMTIEQSQKNFLVYQEFLQRITEQYGLSLIANEINYSTRQTGRLIKQIYGKSLREIREEFK